MTNFSKKIFLCSFLFVSLAFAAKPESQKRVIDKTVAIVNQSIILLSEFEDFRRGAEAEFKKDPKNHAADDPELFRKRILEQMIEDKLMDQEIKTMGLEASESQLENVIDEIMKNNGLQTKKDLERALRSEKITYEEFVEQYRKRIARSNFVNQVIRPKIKISDDEIDAEYKKRVKENPDIAQYNVSMILIKKTDTDPIKIEKLQKSLKSMEDFARAADQLTEGPGKGQGGHMGWITPSDIHETLGTALKKMKKGDISSVLETESGYYILACIDQKRKANPENEKIRNQITDERMNELITINLNQYLVDLKRKAHIETFL